MGEILRSYGNIKIKGKDFSIELNEPVEQYTGGVVHVQNSQMRIDMTQRDFYKFVVNLNLAKENLKRMKVNLLE